MKRKTLLKRQFNMKQIKFHVKKSSRSVITFLIFDIGTLLYSTAITIYLWILIEMTFAYLAAVGVPHIYPNIKPEWEAFIFGLLHGLILLASILAYYSTSNTLSKLKKTLKAYNLEYTLHSSQWDQVYLAILSTALSFYFLSIIILLVYATEPNKLKGTLLLDQALYSLLTIIYLPLTLQIWKLVKIKAYRVRAKRQPNYLIPKEIQNAN